MPTRGEVLVAILNNPLDLAVAQNKHWYRIPVSSVEKWLKDRWPPQWLAFYQTKAFPEEEHAINRYARVTRIKRVQRWELFPDQPHDETSHREYYQLFLHSLQMLPQPILSRRRRRIVFIPTTWQKFIEAVEVNDLYDESSLEDRLWAEFKRLKIAAERQEFVQVGKQYYSLDFAIPCALGNVDVETDGDVWHANPDRAPQDNLRDNDLETMGWRVLRFNDHQIQEEMQEYCLPTITENINRLGGVDEGKTIPRRVDLDAPDGLRQLTLFDE